MRSERPTCPQGLEHVTVPCAPPTVPADPLRLEALARQAMRPPRLPSLLPGYETLLEAVS